MLGLLRQTGLVAKLVLLLLALFSIRSWAIMWNRHKAFRTAESATGAFLEDFRETPSVREFKEKAGDAARPPLGTLFRAGYQELVRSLPPQGEPSSPERDQMAMRNMTRGLERAAQEETVGLERGLGFLATTASATPFVGLFGTVWGIMNAFHGIGLTGTASLEAVAPGIAEALINTAAGLAAAIPAVIGYNHFLGRIRRMGVQMENFASEFSAQAERILQSRRKG